MDETIQSLRAAVIGLGGMGRRHVEAAKNAGLRVVAVCDIVDSNFSAVAELCGQMPRTYGHWQALLDRESDQVDVVMIATNGPSHHPITLAAAAARYPFIFCEKPMATSGRAAREMVQACAAGGAKLAVNLARRFHERSLRLKHVLNTGVIGEIIHVNVSVGAGGLGCIGTHYFDLVAWLAKSRAVWVAGEVDRASAPNVRGAQFYDPGGRGMVGYANGMTASYQFSGEVGIMPFMQIIGTQGVVNLDNWSPPHGGRVDIFARPVSQRDTFRTRFVMPELVPFDIGAPMNLVLATQHCIADLIGANAEDTASGGINAVDVVIGFHLSSQREGARVDLPLCDEDLEFDVPIT